MDPRDQPDEVDFDRLVETQRVFRGTTVSGAIVNYQRGQALGRYVILGELGKGGMSVVYSAYDPDLDRKVAIKLLRTRDLDDAISEGSDGQQARLLGEAQALAKLSHPNVIPVFDVGTVDDRVFITMEMVEGKTLFEWSGERERSWREVVAIFMEAGKGLAGAHAAGLVHRDFKPQNVLVGADGSVRVLDFGLVQSRDRKTARETTPTTLSSEAVKGRRGISRLQRGAVMGTPTYMAPEQMAGGSVDAQADQYAFCVSLYQGLFGVPPFAKGSWQQLLADKDALKLQPTPTSKERRVARWLRRVLIRGLDPDPTRRWPSMKDLLQALGRDPGRRTMKATAVVLGVSVALASGWGYGKVQQRQQALCSGGLAQVEGIWDETTKRAIENRFLESGLNYADDTWQRVQALLDDQTFRWAQSHRDACEATHLRKEQSPAVMDLRMACLDRHLRDLRSTIELFRVADPKVVRNAVKALSALEPVQGCDRIDRLQDGPAPPPADKKGRVDRLEQRIADSQALRRSGKYPQALGVAEEVFEQAVDLGYRPVITRSQFVLGRLQYDVGDYEAAEKTLREASWSAEGQRQDDVAAEAQIVLVATVGDKLRRKDEGLQWGRHAEAMVARIAPNDNLEAGLWTSLGSTHSSHGEFDKAKEYHRRALEVDYRSRGADHLMVGIHHNNLGTAAARLHQTEEASASFRRAIEIFERQIGPHHPNVGVALLNFGATLSLASKPEEAKEPLERSIRILEGALGQSHPYIAHAAQNLAAVLDSLGDKAEAARLLRRSIAIQEEALGSTHPTVAELLSSLSSTLRRADRHEDADEVVAKLRALAQEAESAEPLISGWWHLAEGRMHAMRGHRSDAVVHFEKGVALLDKHGGLPEDLAVGLLIGLGESLREMARPAGARPILERVIQRSPPPEDKFLAKAHFELARCVVADQEDLVLARSLAEKAIAEYGRAGRGYLDDADEIARWIDETIPTSSEP